MASTQALSAAAQDRKARLAQLKSLKRKAPTAEPDEDEAQPSAAKSPRYDQEPEEPPNEEEQQEDIASKYLSGRNYDSTTKGARLGFESAPSDNRETLEKKAAALALETKRQREEEEKADKPLDLFKLQPKKPNWDLKRDLERKLEILNVRTDNAIARIVRERIAAQQKAAREKEGMSNGEAEAAGIDGATLVEATNVREREDEEEARREREEDEALEDGT